MKAENRGKLVRGVVIFSQWRAGYISKEAALDEDNTSVTALYTPWHRHDEDLTILDAELERLEKLVNTFESVDGSLIYFEYRDYKR